MSQLTSSRPSDEPQIVELGHVVLDDGGGVPQLGAPVFIVAGADGDQSAVLDAAEADDAEGRRQRLVGAPVRGQRRANDGRTAGADQLTGQKRRRCGRIPDDLSQRPVGPEEVRAAGRRRRSGRCRLGVGGRFGRRDR